MEPIPGVETQTLANFFGVPRLGANEPGAVKTPILRQGEKASLQNEAKPRQRQPAMRDGRECSVVSAEFPLFSLRPAFPGVLSSLVCQQIFTFGLS